MNLEGKVIVVTGGGQGIGKGIVEELIRLGALVAIFEKDAEAGEEVVRTSGDTVRFFKTDTSDEASVQQAVAGTLQAFGAIDGLVNNAGIADPTAAPVEELSLEDWNRVIGVNLTGYFLCAKHAVRHLRMRKGAIVNIASTRALQSEPDTLAYSASKGGVVALTHALAISLGPDVRVNCISPGWIVVSEYKKSSKRQAPDLRPEDHAQHPVGRAGVPADIAHLTCFLLSDDAGFITGQNIVADGGMTRKMIYLE